MTTNNSVDFVSSNTVKQYFGNPYGNTYFSGSPTPHCPSTNIALTQSGSTFTIQDARGQSLSSDNPALVTLALNSSWGLSKTYLVTSNVSFTTIVGARFGVTSGVNWSADVPFYLYAVADTTDTNVAFMISRSPCAAATPAASRISKAGSIVNTGINDFYSLQDVTVANYANSSCFPLGAFRMTFAGASDTWTPSNLNSNDGIFKCSYGPYSMVAGQNGAAASTFILANAGTEPQFTTNQAYYQLQCNGMVVINYELSTASVAGVGANAISVVLPAPSHTTALLGYMWFDGTTYRASNARILAGNSYADLYLDSGTAQQVQSDIIAGSTIWLNGQYQAWISTS